MLICQDAKDILESIKAVGYAHVVVQESLSKSSFSLCRAFYGMPLEQRLLLAAYQTAGVLGYYPSEVEAAQAEFQLREQIPVFSGAKRRGYSSFDYMANPNIIGTSPLFSSNRWPSGDSIFREDATSLYRVISSFMESISKSVLAEMSESGILENRGWAGVVNEQCCSILRLLKYQGVGSECVSKSHTDYEFLTLSQANRHGLEVRGPDGQWRSVDCPENSAVILLGDMMEAFSNGRIKASEHRVRFGPDSRFSVVYFQGFRLDQEVSFMTQSKVLIRTFGDHICGMLVRSTPHLNKNVSDWSERLGMQIPIQNPFRKPVQ